MDDMATARRGELTQAKSIFELSKRPKLLQPPPLWNRVSPDAPSPFKKDAEIVIQVDTGKVHRRDFGDAEAADTKSISQ